MEEICNVISNWPFEKAKDGCEVIGIRLFQWNRVGIVMQFIGASFIIAEILGDRILEKHKEKVFEGLLFICYIVPGASMLIFCVFALKMNILASGIISSFFGCTGIAFFFWIKISAEGYTRTRVIATISYALALVGTALQMLAA